MKVFAYIYLFVLHAFSLCFVNLAWFWGSWSSSVAINILKTINLLIFGIPHTLFRLLYAIYISILFSVGKIICSIFFFVPFIGPLFGVIYYIASNIVLLVVFPFQAASKAILDAMLRQSGDYYEYYDIDPFAEYTNSVF